MMPSELMVNKWLEHCREAGHRTQGEALEAGEEIADRKDLATYANGQHTIYCNARGCKWLFVDPSQERE